MAKADQGPIELRNLGVRTVVQNILIIIRLRIGNSISNGNINDKNMKNVYIAYKNVNKVEGCLSATVHPSTSGHFWLARGGSKAQQEVEEWPAHRQVLLNLTRLGP